MPTRTVKTTCAYCGVGCSFDAEMRGDELVRMTPSKEGGANEGHSCVKGRFAWGYATHRERVTVPMVRESITDEWREVSWDEAISFTARRFKELQEQYGPDSIGGITSSRCTNEEVFVVQKMVRAAFGNNNVDTCARVCHSPTGYGLKQTFGTSAGTQDFKSVDDSDVILLIGANPTDAHPVFGSRMKQRLRAGAQLIVVDPRRIDLVRTPHVEAVTSPAAAARHQRGDRQRSRARRRHRRTGRPRLRRGSAARTTRSPQWEAFIARPENSPEATEATTGVPASEIRAAARLYATVPNAAIYYGLGVTEHSQGSTMVMGMANLAMATGNIGRDGVGVNPLRGQNNVQGSCDMGSFPHEFSGYRHVSDDTVRVLFEEAWGREMRADPGLRIPNMFDAAVAGTFRGLFVQGEDVAQSDPNITHVTAALTRARPAGRARPVHQRDRQVRSRLLARHVVPREGRHLHQRRAPHQPRPSGHGVQDRQGRVAGGLRHRHGHGLPDGLRRRVTDHGRDRAGHADVRRSLVRPPRRGRQPAVAVQRRCTGGNADHARRRLRARQGSLRADALRAHRREGQPQVPACC